MTMIVKNNPIPVEIRNSPELVRDFGMAFIAVNSGLTKVKRISEALWIFAKGRSLGLSPAEALDSFHVVDGRPTMSAQLMLALMKRAGYRCIDRSEPGKYGALEVFERDTVTQEWVSLGTSKFTTENAKAAGLLGKKNWIAWLDDMLWNRAVSRGARRYAPHVLMGAIYTPEEMGADVDEDGSVTYDETTTAEAEVVIDPFTNDPTDAEIGDGFQPLDLNPTSELVVEHIDEQPESPVEPEYWKVESIAQSKTGKDYCDVNLVNVNTAEKKKFWASNRIVLSTLDKALALNGMVEIITEKRQIIDAKKA